MIFVENALEIMLCYLCILATFGVVLKIWQLFGMPNK